MYKFYSIQAYKYDGTFHRFWNHCLVIEETKDYIVLFSSKLSAVEKTLRTWTNKCPCLLIFFKNKWCNYFISFRDEEISYYINLASPLYIEEDTIKFIDFDLDIKISNNYETKVFDNAEYNLNITKYGYDEKLQKIIANELENTLKEIKEQNGFFNRNTVLKYKEKYSNMIKKKV